LTTTNKQIVLLVLRFLLYKGNVTRGILEQYWII